MKSFKITFDNDDDAAAFLELLSTSEYEFREAFQVEEVEPDK